MIVLISDLHLTDGTFDYEDPAGKTHVSHDISPDAFRLFWEDVAWMVSRRKVEALRDQKPGIEEITVVLLGDIFEMRSTTQWVAGDYLPDGTYKGLGHRPWNEKSEEKPSATCESILKTILAKNRNLECLTTVDRKDHPVADELKRLREQVDVSFVYVAGNHDSLIIYHKDDALRSLIENELGWKIVPASGASPLGVKYVNSRLGIAAEHGHRGDWMDFYNDYYQPPLATLLADTLGRLMYRIASMQGLPEDSRKALHVLCMNVDNVRPPEAGLDWLLGNVPEDSTTRNALRRALALSLEDLLVDSERIFAFVFPRIKRKLDNAPWLTRAGLAAIGLLRSKEDVMRGAVEKHVREVIARLKRTEEEETLARILQDLRARIGQWLPEGETEEGPSVYHKNAREEACESQARFVVYGHSHQFEVSPLETCEEPGARRKTFYFNSGTWKRTVQKNLYPEQTGGFQGWARMTYVSFYDVARGENRDRIFDLWHGNLQRLDDA